MISRQRLLVRLLAALCPVVVVAAGGPGGPALHHANAAAPRAASTGVLFSTSLAGMTADGLHDIQLRVTKNAGGAQSVELEITIVLTGTLPPDSPMAALGGEHRPSSSYSFTLPAADLTVGAAGATLDTRHDLGAYGRITAHWRFTTPVAAVSATMPCGGPTLTGQRVAANVSATLALTFPCDGTIHGVLHGTGTPISIGQDVTPFQPSGGAQPNSTADHLTISVVESESARYSTLAIERLGDDSAVLTFSVATTYPAGATLTSAYHAVVDVVPAGSLAVDVQSTRLATLHYRGALGYADLTFRAQSLAATSHGTAIGTPGVSQSCLRFTAAARGTAPYTTSFQNTTAGGWATLVACTAVAATFIRAPAAVAITSARPLPGAFIVRRASPADGARGVPLASVVSVTFNAPLLGTLVDCFCTPAPPQLAYQVGADLEPTAGAQGSYTDLEQLSYDPATRTATWRPHHPLTPHTTYQIQVTASDTRGGSLTWITHFTTGG